MQFKSILKTFGLIVVLLFSSHLSWGQTDDDISSQQNPIEDTDLEDLIIDKMSRNQIIEVIKKVRSEVYKNYDKNYNQYRIKHYAKLNDSLEILNTDERFKVKINYKRKKIKKFLVEAINNSNFTHKPFFDKYSFNDSPHYWLSEFVIRKFVNIPFLDFFNHFDEYVFMKSKDGKLIRIDFYSDNSYEGFFTFDSKFQLKELDFYLLTPYPINHSQSRNGRKMFEKNWTYTKEKVNILLAKDKRKKFIIKKLIAEERIENYNFKRYNKKRKMILNDVNLNFESKLIFEKL